MRYLILIAAVFASSLFAGEASAQPTAKGLLAGLPSSPGAHLDKVKFLGDNQWLSLGSPAPDPKWGKGRGHSWSARMPYAPDFKVAFVFGEGVHGFVKPNGHYMDDLFAYDLNAHRWICLYPGADVKTISLQMDKNGIEVDSDGQPIPLAQLTHGYEQQTYDTDRKKFMFMPGNSEEWKPNLGERRKLWGGGYPYPGFPKQSSPWMYNVATNKFEIQKVQGGCPDTEKGRVLIYVQEMKKAFFWTPTPTGEVWFYDPAANSWTMEKASGPKPPFGIDAVACLDSKRSRIYIAGGAYPVSAGPHAFWCYDLKAKAWIDPQPKGKPCQGDNEYGTNMAAMNYDAVNDVVVLCYHLTCDEGLQSMGWQAKAKNRGIYVYDPTTNAWKEEFTPLPKGFHPEAYAGCASSFYCPEVNAHYFHVAGDSGDNGVMWVYRYKQAKK